MKLGCENGYHSVNLGGGGGKRREVAGKSKRLPCGRVLVGFDVFGAFAENGSAWFARERKQSARRGMRIGLSLSVG